MVYNNLIEENFQQTCFPPRKLQRTLENIDKQLMMNNLPFQTAISSLKYYYGTKVIGFAYENSLSIMIRIPLTYVGGIFKLYKIKHYKTTITCKGNERWNSEVH